MSSLRQDVQTGAFMASHAPQMQAVLRAKPIAVDWLHAGPATEGAHPEQACRCGGTRRGRRSCAGAQAGASGRFPCTPRSLLEWPLSMPLSVSNNAHTCLPQAKTMDVNARAGFYTEKSPKMLLHEWCIAQKRPTPRYRVTPADDAGGVMRCKVH